MTSVAVLGGGSWGTTLADLLARKGHDVRLWAHEAEVVEAINARHENPLFLPGAALAPSIRGHDDAAAAVSGVSVVVSAAPSHAARSVLGAAAGRIPPGALVLSATKGLECDTLLFMSQVAAQVLPGVRFAALSGPSFAREVFERDKFRTNARRLRDTAVQQGIRRGDPGGRSAVIEQIITAFEMGIAPEEISNLSSFAINEKSSLSLFSRAIDSATLLHALGMPAELSLRTARQFIYQKYSSLEMTRKESEMIYLRGRGANWVDVFYCMLQGGGPSCGQTGNLFVQ